MEINFPYALFQNEVVRTKGSRVMIKLLNSDLSRMISLDSELHLESQEQKSCKAVIENISTRNEWLVLNCRLSKSTRGGQP